MAIESVTGSRSNPSTYRDRNPISQFHQSALADMGHRTALADMGHRSHPHSGTVPTITGMIFDFDFVQHKEYSSTVITSLHYLKVFYNLGFQKAMSPNLINDEF